MERVDQRELLSHGEIAVEGRIAGSSNQALLVSVSLDGATALACYKAEAGERPLWDFPDGLWRREVAAYELDRLCGTELVPTTVGREDLPFGPGSLQWWIEHEGDHYFTLRDRPELAGWLRTLCVVDAIANNADRKSGHVLFDGVHPWAIDNGLCFHEEEKLRTVIWDWAGEELDEGLIELARRVATSDGGGLVEWLSPAEVALTLDRADALARSGRFPLPDEDRPWPPYPWPLV